MPVTRRCAAQIAVLSGDPSKGAPYSVRLKFPANYAIPAHSHPTDENGVVASGALTFGMGDKLAKGAAANQTLGVGGYALMPANMNHFAYTGAQEHDRAVRTRPGRVQVRESGRRSSQREKHDEVITGGLSAEPDTGRVGVAHAMGRRHRLTPASSELIPQSEPFDTGRAEA